MNREPGQQQRSRASQPVLDQPPFFICEQACVVRKWAGKVPSFGPLDEAFKIGSTVQGAAHTYVFSYGEKL
ncbi:MAG: hypothetical protein IPK19_42155 [Chloroflexi bacterium]|nr:hypothetical protein [Chloroflexota bacterium]